MPLTGPGVRIATPYTIPGGTADLRERGVIISAGGRADVIVNFRFPMIGRPHIVTGDGSAAFIGEPGMIEFPLGAWALPQLEAAVHGALTGRIGVRPTGQVSEVTPLTISPATTPTQAGAGFALYTMSCTATLRHRVLYDVVGLGDNGVWHVIAPHAVYCRNDWHDFGVAHITDMHVARRIDSFRGILESLGRQQAADGMFQWNDRFRGFIRYANYLHDTGVLDVVVATGDLYDYLYEDDDDRSEGGNAAFLRDLLTGRAPGPHFADVEELRVPIFVVPGNHDYRKNPYGLLFKIHAALWVDRGVKNYVPYNLLWDDALALVNQRNGSSGDDVPGYSIEAASRMIEVDADNQPFRRFLGDRGSYVVQLGSHRIAMLDSSWDVGVVDSLTDALRAWWGSLSEDERSFVGGSPNCEGVSTAELEMTTEALQATPDDGLFIVGIHAPLLNTHDTAYPYFLRETQRPQQSEEVYGFLSRQTKSYGQPENIDTHLRHIVEKHPLWFDADDVSAPTTFVKRGDTQDSLDYGVSRGHSDQLLRLLAGLGSRRPADVVLAGHTHRHNEVVARPAPNGDLVFTTDFYTENPVGYYPTRFLTGWQPSVNGAIEAVTDVTYVEVSPTALASARPWPMPYDAKHKHVVQVPPYADPLATATDARRWWSEHRPLVLQTGALGPMDNNQYSFNGFRMLTVKADVIDKIRFVSMERLHAADYRMSWEDAVRPTPMRRHQLLHRSQEHVTPSVLGSPGSCLVPALGVQNIVYRDDRGHLHELRRDAAGATSTTDLTAGAGGTPPAGDPFGYHDGSGQQVVLYRGTDDNIHSLYWSGGAVGHDNLSAAAGSAAAAGDPVGYYDPANNFSHVYYRSGDGHLHEVYWEGSGDVGAGDLTKAAGATPATGRPSAYLDTLRATNIVVYRGTDGRIRSLYWTTGDVGTDNLSGAARAPEAAGDPVAYYTAYNDANQVVYRGHDGHVHELWWVGVDVVNWWDLSAAAGAPPAASDPAAYYSAGTNTKHVFYRSGDGHLIEIWWAPGGGVPGFVDLTVESMAPPAEGNPTAFTVEGPNTQHAVYRGADQQIHEIRWL